MKYIKLLSFLLISMLWASDLDAQRIVNSAKRLDLDPILAPFYHGVASGDPTANSVMLWTRVSPPDSISITEAIELEWRIATDREFENVVQSGTVSTDESSDYTVKLDVEGLDAYTYYYYDFKVWDHYSLTGRTKTTPSGGVDRLRFAVVSCSNYPQGYFNAYKQISSRNDVDAVIHLGDYIYEYGQGDFDDSTRIVAPLTEIITKDDYRMRHGHYKLDPDLRRLHQQYPFISVWDDHETANNAWQDGAENHDPATEGDWLDRKSAGIQAYYEWMPLRLPDMDNFERIYRTLSYGDMLDLIMLDTRLIGRDEQVAGLGPITDAVNDPDRTILGDEQRQWLSDELSASSAQWKILGQQVMMGRLGIPLLQTTFHNLDQWDGYPADRDYLLNYIMDNDISNVAVITGDIHTSWGIDVPISLDQYDAETQEGSVLVEFVATSVTSPGFTDFDLDAIIEDAEAANPHIKYYDLARKGYVILDVTADRLQGEWHYVPTVDVPADTDEFGAAWYCNDGERHLNESTSPSSTDQANWEEPAPELPFGMSTSVESTQNEDLLIMGAYPNPFVEEFWLQYYVYGEEELSLTILDTNGKVVQERKLGQKMAGLHYEHIRLNNLAAGNYVMILQTPEEVSKKLLYKVK